MIKKLLIKIHRLSVTKSALVLFSIVLTVEIFADVIVNIFNINIGIDTRIIGSKWYHILLICIIAPITETYFFQYLIYNVFEKQFKKNLFLWSAIGASIFGFSHLTSLMYVICASCAGFFLLLWYALLARKYNNFVAFCVIAIVHSLYNTVSFSYWLYLK